MIENLKRQTETMKIVWKLIFCGISFFCGIGKLCTLFFPFFPTIFDGVFTDSSSNFFLKFSEICSALCFICSGINFYLSNDLKQFRWNILLLISVIGSIFFIIYFSFNENMVFIIWATLWLWGANIIFVLTCIYSNKILSQNDIDLGLLSSLRYHYKKP